IHDALLCKWERLGILAISRVGLRKTLENPRQYGEVPRKSARYLPFFDPSAPRNVDCVLRIADFMGLVTVVDGSCRPGTINPAIRQSANPPMVSLQPHVPRHPSRLDRGHFGRDVLWQERGADPSRAPGGHRQEAGPGLQVPPRRPLRRAVF